MPLTLQPMLFTVVNGRRKLVKNDQFLMLSKDSQQIFIQHGQVYAPGGERLNTLPDWFEGEIKKQNPDVLDKVGWTEHRKVGRPVSKENLEKKLAAEAEGSKDA